MLAGWPKLDAASVRKVKDEATGMEGWGTLMTAAEAWG
jgi:hypothetical protein